MLRGAKLKIESLQSRRNLLEMDVRDFFGNWETSQNSKQETLLGNMFSLSFSVFSLSSISLAVKSKNYTISGLSCGSSLINLLVFYTELLKSCFVAPAAFWRVKMWLQKQRDSRHKIWHENTVIRDIIWYQNPKTLHKRVRNFNWVQFGAINTLLCKYLVIWWVLV